MTRAELKRNAREKLGGQLFGPNWVNAIRQSLENLLKSTYKSNLKIPKFIIDSQYKLCYFITIKFKSNVDEQREYIWNDITESCRWWKAVWSSLWNGFVRRQANAIASS